MEKNLEIKKLSDIVEWADGLIRDGRYYEEKYRDDASTAYCCVKAYELWKIRDVALKAAERHSVYINALNKDIADKAAKIDLLEKEIEGRKEGYTALKELMDTKYISIEEHNKICKTYEDKITKLEKESEKWQDLAKTNRDTICNQYDVCEDFKKKITELEEEVKRLNKCIMNKNESINTGNEAIINLRKEIGAHEEEAKKLENRIKEWKATADANGLENQRFKLEIEKLKVDLIHEREKNEKLAKDHAELENDMRRLSVEVSDKDKVIADLEESNRYWRRQSVKDQEEIEKLKNEKANMEDEYGREGFKRYIKYLVKEEERKFEESWKAKLNEELEAIFEEEEKTEVKGVGRTSSGRYPWGAKVNDIPCGEDSIE